MTSINTAEYNKCGNLDRALIWAIESLRRANTDPQNLSWLDLTFRDEARDFCSWEVIPPPVNADEATLVFTAQIPYNNYQPFVARSSWINSVQVYTAHQAPAIPIATIAPHSGQLAPAIDPTIDTLEKLIGFLAARAAGVLHYNDLKFYWNNAYNQANLPAPLPPTGIAAIVPSYQKLYVTLTQEVLGLSITGAGESSNSPFAIYSGSLDWYKLPSVGETQSATITSTATVQVSE